MSKAIAGVMAVLGGGVAVSGAVLLPPVLRKAKATLPGELQKFTDDGAKLDCVQRVFPGLESVGASGTTATTDLDTNFFGDIATEGCLVVNWDKKSHKVGESEKWSGTFRFLWAVKGTNGKGFLVYLLGTASNEGDAQELKWEGKVHVLEKTGEEPNKKWSVQKSASVPTGESDQKSFKKGSDGSNEWNKKFPAPNDALGVSGNPTFWNFFGSADDLAKICADNECKEGTETNFRGYWIWRGKHGNTAAEGQKKLSEWTQNLEHWWKEIFGAQPKVNDVAEKQVGTWERIV